MDTLIELLSNIYNSKLYTGIAKFMFLILIFKLSKDYINTKDKKWKTKTLLITISIVAALYFLQKNNVDIV